MKLIFILVIIIHIFSLHAQVDETGDATEERSYLFIDDHPPERKDIEQKYNLEPGVLFYKIYFRDEEKTSISIPKLNSAETFQYTILTETSSANEKTLPLDMLKYIEVKFKNNAKYNQALKYYLHTLLVAVLPNLVFNGELENSGLNILLSSFPVFASAVSLPAGVSNSYRYEDRSFFEKINLLYSVGLSAGTWPFSSNFKLERYEGNFLNSFGVNLQFQRPYLPYGFVFKAHYCSLQDIYSFKSGNYELLLNPGLKICLMEWNRFRSYLYLGLITYFRDVYQIEDHINQYPYDSFYSKKDLTGNSMEAELRYLINRNFSFNLSLACFSTSRRTRFPVFAGFTYYNSASEKRPVTLFHSIRQILIPVLKFA